ncbi:MAG: hypothetical protein GXP10_08195, partial [Gammaproteobacteria bacterium]|nr:hypothetical protein [Gammaproteobacteria bacterium]
MTRSSNHFQRPIFVLGIPRSGTSLIAGLLKISGAWAGYTVPGGSANPKGFFENVGLRENVSKTILRSMGVDPLGVMQLPELDLSATVSGLADQVGGMIRQEGYAGDTPWLFKDAKLTLTWPQWQYAFPEARWVIVRREPAEIIRSCLNTNFMIQHSSDPLFWQRWVDQYLDRLERLKEADVWWREISAHPIVGGDFGEIRKLVADLDLHWSEQAVSAFVDPDAWHAKKEDATTAAAMP